MSIIKKLFFTLYKIDNSFIRSCLLNSIAKSEGGQPFSVTIRMLYKQYHQIDIGMYSYGGCFSSDNVPAGTKVGRYCSFARTFTILNGNHPAKFKSLHPFFFNPVFGYVNELLITRSKLVIENDVWIGRGAIILPSVTRIENGAIIGAGSVVTENVPPYAIVVGNPGRVIKYRFDEKTIGELQSSRWWEKDIKEIAKDENEYRTFTREIG
jgi:acetyltransferase-like isoleucine patch superfamily enzyme